MSSPPAALTLNGWATIAVFLPPALLLFTVFVALPMAEAAWYGFYNWDGYGRPEKFIGLKNYGYLIGNATFGALVGQQWPDHRGLASHPVAARARDRGDGRRADPGGGLVPHDLLPALYPRGCRGGPDLAFHVRRRLWPRRRGDRRARHAALLPARRQNLGVLGRADRHRVEVFRLPHDALCRRAAGH